MNNNNLASVDNKYTQKITIVTKEKNTIYTIYTPEITSKYQTTFKILLKNTNDKTKTQFILYDKVIQWYQSAKDLNISIEKIYIKSKLGSYTSGGCGIGASLFAGLTASGIFSYMDSYIKKLGPLFLTIYVISVLILGIKILSDEDKKVEMYNMFLEALNNLDYDNNENKG